MREAGLDALLVSGINFAATLGYLRYLTNWAQPFAGEYYLLGQDASGVFLARTAERAKLVRDISGLSACAGAGGADVAREIRKIGARKVGLCSLGTMTAAFYNELVQASTAVRFCDVTSLVDQVRMIKSAEEIAWVRKSAELGDVAFARFGELARRGAEERDIFTDIDYLVRRRGAENTYFMMAADPAPVPKFLDMASERYESGDVLLFNAEIAGPGGYYTQIFRSGTVGNAPADVLEAHSVCREALEAGERSLKPGRTANELFRTMDDVIAKSGLKRGLHIGHAQGLDIYEKPLICADDDTVMRPGMVIVFHPHVELARGGGLLLGETFLVTEEGNEPLHRSSRALLEA
jgi:Xaa-Pro aminopeptidase